MKNRYMLIILTSVVLGILIGIVMKDYRRSHRDTQHEEVILSLKENLSYTDISGKGIYICIDAENEKTGNIANIIDYNKVLVNVVNEIKENGGAYISINEERINQYTEIVLAGNHININSTPIAPPYNIKVIGDMDKLSKYISEESDYLKSIQLNYPINVEIKTEENITMKKMNLPNKLKNIEGE